MGLITYQNKVALNENASIADINKIKASDINEIKNVVNSNWNNLSGTVLYNNTSGSNTNFTLNQSVSDFDYIEVYFGRSTWSNPTKSVKVKKWTNDNTVDFGFFMDLFVGSLGNGYLSILASYATIKETQVTFDTSRNVKKEIPSTTISSSAGEGQISIFQIIGYKTGILGG